MVLVGSLEQWLLLRFPSSNFLSFSRAHLKVSSKMIDNLDVLHRFAYACAFVLLWIPGGYSSIKNTGGGWLHSLGSEILVGKDIWGSSKILIWTIVRG